MHYFLVQFAKQQTFFVIQREVLQKKYWIQRVKAVNADHRVQMPEVITSGKTLIFEVPKCLRFFCTVKCVGKRESAIMKSKQMFLGILFGASQSKNVSLNHYVFFFTCKLVLLYIIRARKFIFGCFLAELFGFVAKNRKKSSEYLVMGPRHPPYHCIRHTKSQTHHAKT